MGRILFYILIGVMIWLLWRGSRRVGARPQPPESARAEDMVACARCGVHMPRSDSREEGGRLVCRDNPRCGAAP
ncbi:MAG TPA: PP0621 family protein [Usitatibacter sp.]|nr:PP0621 family protein [Usitatibacter sp.]